MDDVVAEYLGNVAKALRGSPAELRAQVLEGLAAHVAEARSELRPQTEAELLGLLERVGWPEEIAAEAAPSQEVPQGPARRRRLTPPAMVSLLSVLVTVAALVVVVTRPGSTGPASPTAATTSGTALLGYLPRPTGPLLIETGRASRMEWSFWAEESPLTGNLAATTTLVNGFASPLTFSRGLGTFLVFLRKAGSPGVGGGSGPSGDPRQLPRFAIGELGPGTGLDAQMLMGVTSVRTNAVRITFSGTAPLVLRTLGRKELPGVRFFVASLPERPVTSIVALGARGEVVYRYSNPMPQLPPTTPLPPLRQT
jgi:hypothetical protein